MFMISFFISVYHLVLEADHGYWFEEILIEEDFPLGPVDFTVHAQVIEECVIHARQRGKTVLIFRHDDKSCFFYAI